LGAAVENKAVGCFARREQHVQTQEQDAAESNGTVLFAAAADQHRIARVIDIYYGLAVEHKTDTAEK
jgi:hypothetical protein